MPNLEKFVDNAPTDPKNYFFYWEDQKKYNNETILSFANYVTINFSDQFIRALIFQNHSIYSEINQIHSKHENQSDDFYSESFYNTVFDEIKSKITDDDLIKMEYYHKDMSLATGISVGLINNSNNNGNKGNKGNSGNSDKNECNKESKDKILSLFENLFELTKVSF